MFDRVLIANRGEIACRIERTLRALGVSAVAVHSDVDRHARHVLDADVAVAIGGASPADSYLRIDRVIDAALTTGADAIHPGYGLLSENPALAEACVAAGLVFIGPTPDQLRLFGQKHLARAAAAAAALPLLPGGGLVDTAAEAVATADRVGYPVMLKASSGGGGIGMRRCADAAELVGAFDAVVRWATAAFGSGEVFVERYLDRARHVEVQVFGDGAGQVVTLGERDCSAQRRNQKVIEETPAPGLPADRRAALADAAGALARSVHYRSAGTVEFIVDADSLDFYFLEVNARLQVEHGVTELTHGVDLVAWMVRLAAGDALPELDVPPTPRGWAIEARVYAEDPGADFRPSTGLLTEVELPTGVRVDTWVERGTEVSTNYDPLLAKVLVHAAGRDVAVAAMADAVARTRIGGLQTNLDHLRTIVADAGFRTGAVTTRLLDTVPVGAPAIEVLDGGTYTTVQDLPGRLGYWEVGVPPSGPMDDRSFAIGNRLLGNDAGAAAIEMTLSGATVRFRSDAHFAIAGAEMDADLDGAPVLWWTVVAAPAGAVLRVGPVTGHGCRAYLCVAGGIDVPEYLGSRSTFALGRFGGHAGRTLRAGDVLPVGRVGPAVSAGPAPRPVAGTAVPAADRPVLTGEWDVDVLAGPHGAPDFFTSGDIEQLYATAWAVHFHSDRTGIRLLGPKPTWARPDGGEAGLHPSNIHDNAYAIGTVDFTGDMPIILGRDGPSLGGFVCPATVATTDLWKVGQAKAGDRIRFRPVTVEEALAPASRRRARPDPTEEPEKPVLAEVPGDGDRPSAVYRRAGDNYVLIEYGDNVLDLGLRLRVGALAARLRADAPPGIRELVPGIRSLQVRYDPSTLQLDRLLGELQAADAAVPDLDTVEVPSRIVHLPLSWDDPATRLAIERYMQTVRADAPWCPWNIEFIRRVNGLPSVDAVERIVYDASYLVLGLGDVYLGAPVATPIDPRHRLVTTKYNPARTWTAENSVGIGGAYLCIYGMEGPGGYQFVGRTVQVWNPWRTSPGFEQPWLLRHFDQIRWYPVSAGELLRMRDDFPYGRFRVETEETVFSYRDYRRFLAEHDDTITSFTRGRDAAFAAERRRWAEAGLDVVDDAPPPMAPPPDQVVPDGHHAVRTPMTGNVWRVLVSIGEQITAGSPVAVIEAMKTETELRATAGGTVTEVVVTPGESVVAGQVVLVVAP